MRGIDQHETGHELRVPPGKALRRVPAEVVAAHPAVMTKELLDRDPFQGDATQPGLHYNGRRALTATVDVQAISTDIHQPSRGIEDVELLGPGQPAVQQANPGKHQQQGRPRDGFRTGRRCCADQRPVHHGAHLRRRHANALHRLSAHGRRPLM